MFHAVTLERGRDDFTKLSKGWIEHM